ncbi:M42 family metallopeptidase [Portibacter lacus]|uniref:Peptidase M42 n=1 Tax=Portibacter lacus TaxID=1099794 RepID=A0AA37WFZ8_9BACT|nr:M42 family metallopeptidase [Portibacter lacus]GLR18089.1 peptidase M42 [Portibacter lacus]
MIDVSLLSKTCEIPGAPGYEDRIRNFVIEQVKDLVDEVTIDPMGNVLAVKKGSGDKKVMVAAHMDEIAFITKYIDDEGFIRFHTLGGFDPKTLTAQRVIVHGKEDVIGVMGCKPIHVMTQEERKKMVGITEYFVDTGLPAEKVKEIVEIGSPITRERSLIEMGDCVNSKSIDNRVSVYILIEALKELKNKEIPYDLVAAFTVQEEVGLRGAITSSSGVNPDFGIALDTTIAFDLPGAKPEEKITSLGSGAAIKILDGATICDHRMVSFLKKTANEHAIKWQPEILPAGGTDTAGLQRSSPGGSIAGAISIPTRNLHQVIEMAHKGDIRNCIDLLVAALLEIEDYDWSFK